MIFKRFIYAVTLVLALVTTACNDEVKEPTQDEFFAQIPADADAVAAVNIDSLTFVHGLLPDNITNFISLNDAVLFTVDSIGHEPVLMLRATNPVVLSQAAYDWMQVSFDTADGHQLLSMMTDGGITTFTNSRYVWVMRANKAKAVMLAVLDARKNGDAAKAFRIKDHRLTDAASGRLRINGAEVPVVANVHGNTLRLLTGASIAGSDTAKVADSAVPGVYARVDGTTAVQLIARLTAGLSFTHRMAVNAMSSFIEKAQTVDVQASPADGVTLTMQYNRADADAANIAKTLGTLAANAGYDNLVTTTGDNGVKAGPVKARFDCAASIGIVQASGKDNYTSFTIDITIADGIQNLLKTTPFTSILQ